MPRTNARELWRRINSVENVVAVTGAMKTVAATKLRKARLRVEPARTYRDALLGVWQQASSAARSEALIRQPVRDRHGVELEENLAAVCDLDCVKSLYVVFTADRGLAGAFSTDVVRALLGQCAPTEDTAFLAIGRKGYDLLSARRLATVFMHMPDQPDISFARYLSSAITNMWDRLGIRTFLVFTRFLSVLRREVVVLACQPSEHAQVEHPGILWEPDEPSVLRQTLHTLISAQIYLAQSESRASELAARLTAMDSASQKAEELRDELKDQYNRLRREKITRELVEASSKEI